MNTCLTNVIGFTKTDCDCFTGQFTAEAAKSNSGLFMDQLPETEHILPAVKGMAECGKNMEKHFSTARTNAIAEFQEKLFEEIGNRYKVRQDPFIGEVGQTAFTGTVGTSSQWIGAAYEMRDYKGGLLRIRKAHIGMSTTIASLPVEIWKAYVVGSKYELQNKVADMVVASEAGIVKVTTLTTPIDLPLSDDSNHIVHYLFLIDRTAGFVPLNMGVRCNCNKQTLIEKWMVQGGIQGNDKNNLLPSQKKTGVGDYINGIVLEVDIKCNDLEFICENYQRNPFVETAMNHAILYQACSNLLKSILRSNEINRFALTKREQMSTDSVILHNKFKSRMGWIAENMDLSTNTCYVCNTLNEKSTGPYKTGIRF